MKAARTAAACRIAHLDRQKFNDLMASGDYPCAPQTTPGVPRVFEIPDLIGLFVYARLTGEYNKTSKQASIIACRVVNQLHSKPDATHVLMSYSIAGAVFVSATSQPKKDCNPFANSDGSQMLLFSEIWNIQNVRQLVSEALEEELRVIGNDD